jgi:NADH-quinone oxidoreductase subunit N
MTLGNGASFAYVVPEAILAVTVGLVMAFGVATKRREVVATVALLGFGAALLTAVAMPWPAGATSLFHGNLVSDGMTAVFRPLFLLTGLLTIVFAWTSSEVDGRDFADTAALVASSVLGMCLMSGASDLLTMYLSMEFVGILSYVLAGLKREDQRSSEAALKYVIYGGAASGVMLFGMSLLYGIAGDTSVDAVRQALAARGAFQPLTLLALVMVFAGLGYKVAAVPFHMWCPDVYQGAPTPITAFFSVGPKAAGFALMLRLLWLLLGGGNTGVLTTGLMVLAGVVAVATMTLGNLAALHQASVKRLLAYSSIAHAGYLLLGVATLPAIAAASPDATGFRAVFFYLVMYLFMNLGAFFAVSWVVDRTGGDDLASFRALGQRSPFVAAMMTVFLFSLIGIPPTAGFAGKFYLFYALLKQGGAFYFVLAFIGVLNSFVSLFYYARVLKAMYLERSSDSRPLPAGAAAIAVLALLAVPTLVFGVWFGPVLDVAAQVLR